MNAFLRESISGESTGSSYLRVTVLGAEFPVNSLSLGEHLERGGAWNGICLDTVAARYLP